MNKILNNIIIALRNRITSHRAGAFVLGALIITMTTVSVASMQTNLAVDPTDTATSSLPRAVAETNAPDLPDLLFRRVGILIGGKPEDKNRKVAVWGGEISLTKADSFLQSGGKLAFNLRYFFGNASQSETPGTFTNRIRSDNQVITQQTNLALKSGENKVIDTQCYLAPGRHVIYLSLDDDKVVKESNESNNVKRFIVNVSNQ